MFFNKRKSKAKDSFQEKKNKSENASSVKEEIYLVYQGDCMVDVTFFDAETPDDPFGYVSEGLIELFTDGHIKISNLDRSKILEDLTVGDIFLASNNINGHDPNYRMNVKLITHKKEICLTFKDIKTKGEFWDALSSVRRKIAKRGD